MIGYWSLTNHIPVINLVWLIQTNWWIYNKNRTYIYLRRYVLVLPRKMLPCVSALHWARSRTWFVMCGGCSSILHYGPLIETNNLYVPTPNGQKPECVAKLTQYPHLFKLKHKQLIVYNIYNQTTYLKNNGNVIKW